MCQNDDLKRLLREHDFLPVVRQVDDGCVLTLPHPTLRLPESGRYRAGFVLKWGGESGIVFNSTANPAESFVPVPEYALRPILRGSIAAACQSVPIDGDLAVYLDGRGGEADGLDAIVAGPDSEEARSREGFLSRLLLEAARDGFPPSYEGIARDHGVLDGYRMCLAIQPDKV